MGRVRQLFWTKRREQVFYDLYSSSLDSELLSDQQGASAERGSNLDQVLLHIQEHLHVSVHPRRILQVKSAPGGFDKQQQCERSLHRPDHVSRGGAVTAQHGGHTPRSVDVNSPALLALKLVD